ncbi:MAG: hypothetical protein ACPL4E_09050 [Thermoproteota archaeon]
MSRWLREKVRVDESATGDGRNSHGWKVSLSRTNGCVPLVSGVLEFGFVIYKGPGGS